MEPILIKGTHMTRRFWLIVVLITSFLPWPASQQLFLMAFEPSVDRRLLDSSEEFLGSDVGSNSAWLDQYVGMSNAEMMVFCEFEQELNEGESADGSSESCCVSDGFDWGIESKFLEHGFCIRRSVDRYGLSYPMIKSRIVCRC
ncbi:MAG: hypothetical protein WCJ40_13250 [Planctomycetota bacterium]